MHEILKTEKLLKEHPEEFPESLQKGRMIERLSRNCLLYTSFAVLSCDSSCQGNNFISSIKVNRVELFFYRVKNTLSLIHI